MFSIGAFRMKIVYFSLSTTIELITVYFILRPIFHFRFIKNLNLIVDFKINSQNLRQSQSNFSEIFPHPISTYVHEL